MRVANTTIGNFIAGDMSVNITSPEYSVYQIYGWSAQFTFTGAPVGVLKVQASDDPMYVAEGTTPQPTHWSDISGSSTSISAAGDVMYNFNGSFYNWIRFVYTATSGTGSITGRLNIKGV